MTFTSLLSSPVPGGSGASGQHTVTGHLTTDQFPADPVLFPSRCPSPCLMAAHIAKWKQEEDKHISRQNLSGVDEKTDSAQRESVPVFVYQVAKPLTRKDWWSSCRGTSSFSSSGSEQQISCFGFTKGLRPLSFTLRSAFKASRRLRMNFSWNQWLFMSFHSTLGVTQRIP